MPSGPPAEGARARFDAGSFAHVYCAPGDEVAASGLVSRGVGATAADVHAPWPQMPPNVTPIGS